MGRVIRGRGAVLEIGPGGGNERATAVRKDEHQVELIASVRPAQPGEVPGFEGVVWTGDGGAGEDALEVGNVCTFPSTPPTKDGW